MKKSIGMGYVPLTLIDGPRLRAMVAEFLPQRLAELDRYRGFRSGAATTTPARSPGAGMGTMLTPDTSR